MQTIQFEFALREMVKIAALDIKGIVTMLRVDNTGNMYYVEYWFQGKREATWVFQHELEH